MRNVLYATIATMTLLAGPALADTPPKSGDTSKYPPASGDTARPQPRPGDTTRTTPPAGDTTMRGQPGDMQGQGAGMHTKMISAPRDAHTFAMHLAEHHREGIAMADHVIAKGSNAEVKAIARRIKAEQQKDLATLNAAIKADAGQPGMKQGTAGRPGMKQGTAGQPGMKQGTAGQSPQHDMGMRGSMAMMPKDMDMQQSRAKLMAASGTEADRLFLELMITHHAASIMMEHAAMPHLESNTELRRLANENFAMQAREIGELQRLRESDRRAEK